MSMSALSSWLNFDVLGCIMVCLVTSLTLIICTFAKRYMQGDQYYHRFIVGLLLLGFSVATLVLADNIWLFLLAWCISNLLLVMLMVHKSSWRAAKASGRVAAKTLFISSSLLAIGLLLLASSTQQTSIQAINYADLHHPMMLPIALCCILAAAFAQSALIPCHRWLLSSVNSPTPVSAMMHAGLINGGGFLLIRFSPLFLKFDYAILLHLTFIVGVATAIIGTIWKLMQHDYKRMLACSTVAQMGFMMMQCGLGIFSAAVAHLCWHGFFKAYLFLNSGGAAQEKRVFKPAKVSLTFFIIATFCGISSAGIFALVSGKNFFVFDTQMVLITLAAIAAIQLALTILQMPLPTLAKILLAMMGTSLFGLAYGLSIFTIYRLFEFWHFDVPQPMNALYTFGLLVFVVVWLLPQLPANWLSTPWLKKLGWRNYTLFLNSSQPHPTTVTAHHNHYQYLQ